MSLRAWLLRIIHSGTQAQGAQDLGTVEVSFYAFSQRSQKLITHEVMLFHCLSQSSHHSRKQRGMPRVHLKMTVGDVSILNRLFY